MDKYVVYISGGAMIGVFGAGVMTELGKKGFNDRIETIYASSVGSLIAAYFLSKQYETGSSIFYDDLNSNFVSYPKFWKGLAQRLSYGFFKKPSIEKMTDALDIDYLFKIIDGPKRLDYEAILANPTSFNIKVFNKSKLAVEYLPAAKETVQKALRASVLAVPYVHTAEKINGQEYIDGGIIDQIGIKTILDRHPDKKIIVLFNGPLHRGWTHRIKGYLEGKVTSYMFGKDFYSLFAESERKLKDEFAYIQNHPNIILVTPPKHNPVTPRTTNRQKLLASYQMGLEAGSVLINNL